jgi:hypothetical protein
MRRLVLLTTVRLNYKQEMVLQPSHKKKEMVVSVRKKKEMVTHTLRVQLTRWKLMKNYSGGTKWRPMGMNVGWKRTPQMMRTTLLSYGPPWAHYLGGYQDRLLGGPLGLPSLCHTAPDGVRCKDYGGEILR